MTRKVVPRVNQLDGPNNKLYIQSGTSCIRLGTLHSPCFEGMVGRVYPPELRLGRAGASDAEAPFFDLYLSVSNGFVSSKIYDKRDDFDFDIVNFPFLDGDVPRSASCGV